MDAAQPDPIAQAARIIAKGNYDQSLEQRLKSDLYSAIIKIKPERGRDIDFEQDVMSGRFFANLPTNLQGIAVLKLESAIGFYHRLGFHVECLKQNLDKCLNTEEASKVCEKFQCQNLHDLSYIPHKQLEKLLGKTQTASLYDRFKAHVEALQKTH